MKNILFAMVAVLTSVCSVKAQDKSKKISNLIESKQFAFVVTKIQSLSVYSDNYSNSDPLPRYYPMNLSFVAQGEILGGKAPQYLQDWFGSGQVLPSYYSLYGIEQYPKIKDKYDTDEGEGVFLVQYPDGILLNGDKSPKRLIDINDSDFYAYQLKDMNSEIKKDNNGWEIKYIVKDGNTKRKLEMKIDKNGMAVLKAEPSKDTRPYLFGPIVDAGSLNFNKQQ